MTTQNLPDAYGSFYLYDLIGRGGMAEVFLAKTFTSLGTERQCVIKRVLPELDPTGSFGEMLINEAKLCANLSQANVVQTLDLGKIEGQYYIGMEYVEGFDLNQLLGLLTKAKISLPLSFAIFIIKEMLKGLDYAHRLNDPRGRPLGIIHRDVSPTNVLVSTEGEVKLCDFGIAKATIDHLGTDHVDESILKGKVAYMAPEHVRGEKIDHRADLFAAGILLWELLNGRRLYKTNDEEETLRRARAAEVPPLEDKGYPAWGSLSELVRSALGVSPDERFQSGREFIRAIEEYVHTAGLFVSQLKFSDFLMEHFGQTLMDQRQFRERQLTALMESGILPQPPSRRDSAAPQWPRPRSDSRPSQTPAGERVVPEADAPSTPSAKLSSERVQADLPTTIWVVGYAVALALAAAIYFFS